MSPNYDFVSVRAGIQQFTSDFRGFLFSEEQPGVRLFGNLRSNRLAYNLAWFNFLEKNTNSGLNTFQNRGQQVYVANIYIQDFLAKGYTTEFSFHYNRDDASIHYDDNGFLVRPAPAGAVVNGERECPCHPRLLPGMGQQRAYRPHQSQPRFLPGPRPRRLQSHRRTPGRHQRPHGCRRSLRG